MLREYTNRQTDRQADRQYKDRQDLAQTKKITQKKLHTHEEVYKRPKIKKRK